MKMLYSLKKKSLNVSDIQATSLTPIEIFAVLSNNSELPHPSTSATVNEWPTEWTEQQQMEFK